MRRHQYVSLRSRHDIPIRRREDVPLRRLGDVSLSRHWVFHLRRRWDIQKDVVMMSPRHLVAGWDVYGRFYS